MHSLATPALSLSFFQADYGNGQLRRLVLSTNVVDAIAGKSQTYGTSDGIGSAARFNALSLSAVALDSLGVVAVAVSLL